MSTNNRNLSSRDIERVDNNKSNLVPIILGCSVVCTTLGLSICGVTAAVRNINRDSEMSMVLAQQNYDAMSQNTPSNVVITDNKWTSTQIDWMSENNITYNEDGLPVDASGNVVDDPTTKIDETKITSERRVIDESVKESDVGQDSKDENNVDASQDASVSDNTSDIEPDIKSNWVDGKDWVQTSKDGRYYYSVQKGDTLTKIATMSGFTLESLISNNDISNPNMINVGQRIYFPSDGPVTNDVTNLGLG